MSAKFRYTNCTNPRLRDRCKRGLANSTLLVLAAALLLGAAAAGAYRMRSHNRVGGSVGATKQLRIGYQKSGILNLQRLKGDLDRKLDAQGVKIEWLSFPAGPQLLEAIAVGGVDIGWTGDAPAVFALAAGNDLAYLANSTPDNAGASRAILVPAGSAIKNVTDLRGKRVAVQKGSGVHNLLVQTLERYGIAYSDIHPIYLAPPDARAAFESGAVDAWAIWDPYLAIEQKKAGVVTVANGEGIVTAGGFYLSSKHFARTHPEWIKIVLGTVEDTAHWAGQNPKAAADLLAPEVGLDASVLETTVRRLHAAGQGAVETGPITDDVLVSQQKVADEFLRIGLLSKRVDVRQGLLTQQEYGAIQPPANAVRQAVSR